MCFSAEASLSVGAALGIGGIITLKNVKKRSHYLIAFVPLLFGIQQILEGLIWLHMDETFIQTSNSQLLVNAYLFFAWLFWPIYIPAAYFLAENVQWRRFLFCLAFLIGVVIFYKDLLFLSSNTVVPSISGRRLYYGFTPFYDNLFYGLTVFIPIFLSSIPQMWVFGAVLLASFVFSQLIYAYTFTSVWCFFSAISSIVLIKVLYKN